MRTTVDLDADVLRAARSIARLRGVSLGRAVSDLAQRGLSASAVPLGVVNGFPVFAVAADAPPITDDMVAAALDDE